MSKLLMSRGSMCELSAKLGGHYRTRTCTENKGWIATWQVQLRSCIGFLILGSSAESRWTQFIAACIRFPCYSQDGWDRHPCIILDFGQSEGAGGPSIDEVSNDARFVSWESILLRCLHFVLRIESEAFFYMGISALLLCVLWRLMTDLPAVNPIVIQVAWLKWQPSCYIPSSTEAQGRISVLTTGSTAAMEALTLEKCSWKPHGRTRKLPQVDSSNSQWR